jgi:hypothetical protein
MQSHQLVDVDRLLYQFETYNLILEMFQEKFFQTTKDIIENRSKLNSVLIIINASHDTRRTLQMITNVTPVQIQTRRHLFTQYYKYKRHMIINDYLVFRKN